MSDSTEKQKGEEKVDLPDEALEMMRQQRFRERVERVLEVMQRERIDWRGLPFIKPDGRIGVRVAPFDSTNMTEGVGQ